MSERDDYIDEAGYVLTAVVYGLSGAEWLADLPLGKIRAAYNGIGPEWMKPEQRKKLSKWLKRYTVPCVLHDCRFQYDNDGTDAKFRVANNELERNCVIIADETYAWYNPLRYWARLKGRAIAAACRIGGWSAWRKAYKKQFPAGAGNAGGERQTLSFLDGSPSA